MFLENTPIRYKLIIMLALPLAGLFYFCAQELSQEQRFANEMQSLRQQATLATKTSRLVHGLQKERGLSGSYLASRGNRFIEARDNALQEVDGALAGYQSLLQQATVKALVDSLPDLQARVQTAQKKLQQISVTRTAVKEQKLSVAQTIRFYTEVNRALLDISALLALLDNHQASRHVIRAYVSLLEAKELAGLERVVLSSSFTRGHFEDNGFTYFIELVSLQENHLKQMRAHMNAGQRQFAAQLMQGPYFEETALMRENAYRNDQGRLTGEVKAEHWWEMQTGKIDTFQKIEDFLAKEYVAVTSNEERAARNYFKFLVFTIGVGLLLVIVLSYRILTSINRPLRVLMENAEAFAGGNLEHKTTDLEQHRLLQRSDELGDMAKIFQRMTDTLSAVVRELVTVSNGLAGGKLNQHLDADYPGDLAQIKSALETALPDQEKVIKDIVRLMQSLACGELNVSPEVTYKGDFHAIQQALESALPDLRKVIGDIVRISGELAENRTNISLGAEYQGDFKEIKDALLIAAEKLAAADAANKKQDWLKSGQTRLAEKLGGEQSMTALAEQAIQFLSTYMDMQAGVFYLVKQTQNGENEVRLQIAATYAYTRDENAPRSFSVGEGLAGEVAQSQEAMVIRNVPADYFTIRSGLGNAVPTCITLYPIMHEAQLKGVIEFASLHDSDETRHEFMQQVLPSIGVALNVAASREQMQILLEKTQAQTEELQSQSEELETQSEELRQANEELEMRMQEAARNKKKASPETPPKNDSPEKLNA